MDPNLNRNSMGSRAGTSIKPKFGAGTVGAVSRQGTALKGLNPIGGVGSTVEMKERPLTIGGGINGPQSSEPKRKVYDRNYYVTKTKEKLLAIQEETEKLKKKSDTISRQQQLYNKLEARLEELNSEVRSLEGQLADYNLALDKLRTNTRPEDVRNAFNHVNHQNKKLKSELDEIFLSRKKVEEETEQVQNQMAKIHKQMQLRLNELDPYQRNEYQKLMSENNDLVAEYSSKAAAMDQLHNKLTNAENKLKMDSQKLKGQMLKEQIAELQTKRTDYEIQLNEANLSIPEARERILARMKEDNASIGNMEKRTKQVKKNIDIYQKKLRELQANLEDKKTEEEDKRKYEILYQRDKEMDQFLNSFDRIRSNQLNELASINKTIYETMEQTGKVLEIFNQLPTQQGGLGRNDRSQNSLIQTKAEYEIRLNLLRNLQNTEKRTDEQMSASKANIAKMREDISEKFDNVEQVTAKLNKTKQKLLEEEKALQQLKDKISPTIASSDHQCSVQQKTYQMNDQYATYSASERKLQEVESNRYYMKHYINTKSKDINYEDIKNECMAFSEELNKKLLKGV